MRDFHEILSRMIGTRTGVGKTGGKGAEFSSLTELLKKRKEPILA
ncbi:MAG: hypothetical protein R2883_01285 [Caldisericia bacterium]